MKSMGSAGTRRSAEEPAAAEVSLLAAEEGVTTEAQQLTTKTAKSIDPRMALAGAIVTFSLALFVLILKLWKLVLKLRRFANSFGGP